DLPLSDGKVSRPHAKLVPTGPGKVLLVDLQSTNGTWVGSVRVREAVLEDGDEFRAGDTVIAVSRERPSKPGGMAAGGAGDPRIGSMIGHRYRVVDVVSRGGRGVVYLAGRALLGDRVAVMWRCAGHAKRPAVGPRFARD